jgi:hypothetical protein
MLTSLLKPALVAISLMLIGSASATAALPSVVNLVVLRVSFPDTTVFPAGTRFNPTEIQTNFNSIAQLWSNTSYGNISLSFQFAGPFNMPKTSPSYLGSDGQSACSMDSKGNCTDDPLGLTITDAVANVPTTIDWSNVYGVIVLFSDRRPNGFYRGWTLGQRTISPPVPPGTKPISRRVFASVVGEQGISPSREDAVTTWGRCSHEIGHQMQAAAPPHPSNYASDFEQMDAEYPAQSGVFEKQSNTGFPGWLPTDRYLEVRPPEGGAANIGLLAEERPPSFPPLYQAIKAFLSTGGTQKYYLISLRERVLGDNLATTHGPNGIPDQGVLIERVVEGGDSMISDRRWVNVIYRGCSVSTEPPANCGSSDTLWHARDTYSNTTDGIFIFIGDLIDSTTAEAIVDIRYSDITGQPDVGINSWLAPPGTHMKLQTFGSIAPSMATAPTANPCGLT